RGRSFWGVVAAGATELTSSTLVQEIGRRLENFTADSQEPRAAARRNETARHMRGGPFRRQRPRALGGGVAPSPPPTRRERGKQTYPMHSGGLPRKATLSA